MAELDLNLLDKVSQDRALASALLFDHRHDQPLCPSHIAMIDAWRSADEFVAIEAHREFGKTTLSEEFLTLEGCFGNYHYGLIIGETYEKACARIYAIDYECRTNLKLHRLFGGDVLGRKSIENKIWFKSGALLEALGWDQELQSFKFTSHRPDRAYLDDPENQTRVRDKTAVDDSMRKLYLELIPAMDKKRRKVRLTQTRRAEDCMMTRLAKNTEWIYKPFPICDRDPMDPEAKPLWPERYPIEWIRSEMRNYASNGMLREFLQSYMLIATDTSARPFKREHIKASDASPWHWMPKVAIYDPARTAHERRTREVQASNRYGKVVVSRRASTIYVHESSGRHWKPSELIEDIFSTFAKHQPSKIAVEKDSLDDWILQPLRLEMLRRGISLPLVPVNAPRDRSKDEFILGLQPFAESGDIVLIGGPLAHPELVAELENFPQGTRDVVNCLAYSLRMFAGDPIYPDFSGANIAEAPVARRGETVYVGWMANETETVAVAMLRDQRRLAVARDYCAMGPEAVRVILGDLRADFPLSALQSWAPAEAHDQWQRVALVAKLREARAPIYQGEHAGPARGCLSDRIRSVWRDRRMFTVDRKAPLTMNALAMGYCYPSQAGGRVGRDPEPGTSRLVAEAIECVGYMLGREVGDGSTGLPKDANVDVTPGGIPYMTAHPRR